MKNKKGLPAGRQAVVLLSGGLDSATALYVAKAKGYKCQCLIFDYGQRHRREINAAVKIAKKCGCAYRIIKISLPWKGSSLLDKKKKIARSPKAVIPSTYVPGRNIIFLSFALSFAESIGAAAIFIGAHAHDYSGYPDCRPEFFRAFRKVVLTGTKAGAGNNGIKIITPLLHKGKADIIRLGSRLKVPFALTWSCYLGGKKPCGRCDSCYYRNKGFKEAGIKQI